MSMSIVCSRAASSSALHFGGGSRRSTGIVRWDPVAPFSATLAHTRAQWPKSVRHAGELWEKMVDPLTHHPYYFCRRTGGSMWTVPGGGGQIAKQESNVSVQ